MKKLLTTTIALVASFSLATAEDEKKPGGKKGKGDKAEMLKKLDTDGDHAISKAEWGAGPLAQKDADKAKKVFAHLDADGDGKIEGKEMKKARGGARGKGEMLKKLDTDGDHAISKAEWGAGPLAQKDADKAKKVFAHLDADGDGKIDGREMKKARGGKGKGKGGEGKRKEGGKRKK